jgi:hypothetical protein
MVHQNAKFGMTVAGDPLPVQPARPRVRKG